MKTEKKKHYKVKLKDRRRVLKNTY